MRHSLNTCCVLYQAQAETNGAINSAVNIVGCHLCEMVTLLGFSRVEGPSITEQFADRREGNEVYLS